MTDGWGRRICTGRMGIRLPVTARWVRRGQCSGELCTLNMSGGKCLGDFRCLLEAPGLAELVCGSKRILFPKTPRQGAADPWDCAAVV